MTSPHPSQTAHPQPGLTSFLLRIGTALGAITLGLLALLATLGSDTTSETSSFLRRIAGGVLISTLVVGTLVILARRVEMRPLEAFGLNRPPHALRAFALGVIAWVAPALITFTVLALLGTPLTVTVPAPEFLRVLLLLALAVLLVEALPEELVFRGYLTGVLGERLEGWWVIGVQTFLFTGFALLLRGYTGLNDLSLFIAMGVGLGYMRMVTGSVWTTVGFHLAFQTGSQLVLTHDVTDLPASTTLSMLALGSLPFAAGAILLAALASARPTLFASPRDERVESAA